MPNEIRTDARLLSRLASSAKARVTKEQLRRQRVSFVYGNLPAESPITRAQVESALAKLDGEAIPA